LRRLEDACLDLDDRGCGRHRVAETVAWDRHGPRGCPTTLRRVRPALAFADHWPSAFRSALPDRRSRASSADHGPIRTGLVATERPATALRTSSRFRNGALQPHALCTAPFLPVGNEITHRHTTLHLDPLANCVRDGGASATTRGYMRLRCRRSAICFTHIKILAPTQSRRTDCESKPLERVRR
jgi:hypothetical protein